MAKVRGPLMSLDASGTVAGDTRLRHMRGHVLMYRGGAPGSVKRKAPSESQMRTRERYAYACQRWRVLTPEQRRYWENFAMAAGEGLSAWNCFLACVLRRGSCVGAEYFPPLLTTPIALALDYQPPPLTLVLTLAE